MIFSSILISTLFCFFCSSIFRTINYYETKTQNAIYSPNPNAIESNVIRSVNCYFPTRETQKKHKTRQKHRKNTKKQFIITNKVSKIESQQIPKWSWTIRMPAGPIRQYNLYLANHQT